MPLKGSKRVAQAEETARKMAQALEWRKQGWSLWAIGQAMDPPCSGPYVSNLLKKALKEIVQEPAEELVKIELERLDDMWQKQYQKAVQKGNTLALESCLKIMERRAKLLGLDKPTKVAATDPSGENEAAPPAVQVYMPDNGRG